MLEFIYALSIIALPIFIVWVIIRLNTVKDDIERLRRYSKLDHKVFTNELSSAHSRINQLEMIVFSSKKDNK